MSTATSLSLLEAAQRVGRSKPTILRAIQAGKISATRDEPTGEWRIEPAELFRVYPPLPEGTDAPVQDGEDEAPRTTSADERNWLDSGGTSTVARTAMELQVLKRELERQREERDRERRQLEESVSDLRRRLDASEEERRQKDAQLTHLLTDQRQKKEADASRPKGWLARLLGN
jgi:excisionase family DNA binding protein